MKSPQDIILKPMITEQSVDNMQQSKYKFKVAFLLYKYQRPRDVDEYRLQYSA